MLFRTNTAVKVVSLIGAVMVVGIVAKNGILIRNTINNHLLHGESVEEALLSSGRRRFRAVLMTSLVITPSVFAVLHKLSKIHPKPDPYEPSQPC